MALLSTAAKTVSISTSLLASGGIATLSLFDVPELQSQPASRSLPSIRWLFSRGSHVFPTAAFISSAGFLYLAMNALPQGRAFSHILRLNGNSAQLNGYLTAALLNLAIGPFTSRAMIPTNFALIEMNERKGGGRSQKSAQEGRHRAGERSADDSVNGEGDVNQFTDLSGPQEKAARESIPEEDEKARELLGRFGRLNAVRAVLTGAGGIIGLVAALS